MSSVVRVEGRMPLFRAPEPVSDAAHRLEKFAAVAKLRSQPGHVHVHRSRLDLCFRIPGGLEELPSGLNTASPLQKYLEQAVLERRQLHLLAIAERAV